MKATKAALVDLAAAHGLETVGTKKEIRERLLGKLERAPEVPARPPPATSEGAMEAALPAEVPETETPPETPGTGGAGSVPVMAEAEVAPEVPAPEVDAETAPEEAPPLPEPAPPVEVAAPSIAAVAAPAASAEVAGASAPRAPSRRKPPRADRFTFYLGAAEVAFGGSFLLLGSLLHDLFRVPVVGTSYGTFGGVNVLFAFLGGLFLAAGAGAMAVGARRGSRRRTRAAGG